MLTGKEWEQVCRNSPEAALVQMVGSGTISLLGVYAAQAELIRRSNISSCPALDKWRSELAAGLRTADQFDDLWRAACDEMNQREWDAILSRRPPTTNHPRLVDDDLLF
jgi:hypothetical protein